MATDITTIINDQREGFMRVIADPTIEFERDEEKMKTFADAVGQMSHDMDVALDRLGMKFGDQWKDYQLKEAA